MWLFFLVLNKIYSYKKFKTKVESFISRVVRTAQCNANATCHSRCSATITKTTTNPLGKKGWKCFMQILDKVLQPCTTTHTQAHYARTLTSLPIDPEDYLLFRALLLVIPPPWESAELGVRLAALTARPTTF